VIPVDPCIRRYVTNISLFSFFAWDGERFKVLCKHKKFARTKLYKFIFDYLLVNHV
jgi:hypothetical protein